MCCWGFSLGLLLLAKAGFRRWLKEPFHGGCPLYGGGYLNLNNPAPENEASSWAPGCGQTHKIYRTMQIARCQVFFLQLPPYHLHRIISIYDSLHHVQPSPTQRCATLRWRIWIKPKQLKQGNCGIPRRPQWRSFNPRPKHCLLLWESLSHRMGSELKVFLSFFYPFALDLDILFLSSPDFSSILYIIVLSIF